ncbi:unnamed protein product [Nesidiocoris tenuis]|uniref:Uncharacterized protein n=1 Tax=Nesidiocoris tenuis TaxID=355587 RepID=A0A6H5H1H2_9HEMI|nr:unnamed protein product [Nesidiocoris tenuis]
MEKVNCMEAAPDPCRSWNSSLTRTMDRRIDIFPKKKPASHYLRTSGSAGPRTSVLLKNEDAPSLPRISSFLVPPPLMSSLLRSAGPSHLLRKRKDRGIVPVSTAPTSNPLSGNNSDFAGKLYIQAPFGIINNLCDRKADNLHAYRFGCAAKNRTKIKFDGDADVVLLKEVAGENPFEDGGKWKLIAEKMKRIIPKTFPCFPGTAQGRSPCSAAPEYRKFSVTKLQCNLEKIGSIPVASLLSRNSETLFEQTHLLNPRGSIGNEFLDEGSLHRGVVSRLKGLRKVKILQKHDIQRQEKGILFRYHSIFGLLWDLLRCLARNRNRTQAFIYATQCYEIPRMSGGPWNNACRKRRSQTRETRARAFRVGSYDNGKRQDDEVTDGALKKFNSSNRITHQANADQSPLF